MKLYFQVRGRTRSTPGSNGGSVTFPLVLSWDEGDDDGHWTALGPYLGTRSGYWDIYALVSWQKQVVIQTRHLFGTNLIALWVGETFPPPLNKYLPGDVWHAEDTMLTGDQLLYAMTHVDPDG